MISDACKKEEEQRREFFETRTPEDPAYYSPRVLDIHDYKSGKMLTKRGQDIMERLRSMDWQEVLREYLRNWITGMRMLHVVSTDFNTGNSSPAQYGWYPEGYLQVAYDKLRASVLEDHPIPTDGKCRLDSHYSHITVERDLGYGKKVSRTIDMSIEFYIPHHMKGICYKCSAEAYGDNGFYDEFVQYAKELQSKMEAFKKEPLLKTDLRPYDTYPDISSYKDRRDQLGIIRHYMVYDTVGKRDKCRFTQGFIDAYKDARDFCKALPDINFSEDRDTFEYNGKTYTAEEYDFPASGLPDEIKYVGQLAEDVLLYKYGLLDAMVEYKWDKESEARSFIWHWRDTLHQKVTPYIKEWIEKWIPVDRINYVMGK